MFIIKMGAPLVGLVLLILSFGMVKKIMTRYEFSWNMLFNAVGALFSVLYITIALATLTPFQCYAHPNGKKSMCAFLESKWRRPTSQSQNMICWKS